MNFFKKQENKTEKRKEEKKELKFEELLDERKQIVKEIEKSLDELLFTDEEKKETIEIIDITYQNIQKLKDMLIGTNIDNDPERIEKETFALIEKLTQQMQLALAAKVKEIMARRAK